MPAKEIKELRQTGKLEEALQLALEELESALANYKEIDLEEILESQQYLRESEGKVFNYDIEKMALREELLNNHVLWQKRNISWVYYDYLKLNNSPEKFDNFIEWLDKIKKLKLPKDEKILFEQLCWQIGKMIFSLLRETPIDIKKGILLFDTIVSIDISGPSESYTFLFKALHKILKDSDRYLDFADWWDFQNFMPEDYKKEITPNGLEIMAIAEQGYIAYAKQLLPKNTPHGEINFDREKVLSFLPKLSKVVDDYPQFQYPAYFNAKLLLAIGESDNMLKALLPFARKKKNDFWVWEIMAEAFKNDSEKVFSCYCKSLTCKSPDEMLVNIRQKMASVLISKGLFSYAKKEIELIVNTRNTKGYSIPPIIKEWQNQSWYNTTETSVNNYNFYKENSQDADNILFGDVAETKIFVEFINSNKKVLNFFTEDEKTGLLQYERLIKNVKIGDTFIVRFQGPIKEGMNKTYTFYKIKDDAFENKFYKNIKGCIKITSGKNFGFIDDIYVHSSYINKHKLNDGDQVDDIAIKSYNKDKNKWSWKLA